MLSPPWFCGSLGSDLRQYVCTSGGLKADQMQLYIDRRERALSNALEDLSHTLKDLPVGDVLCEYADGRATWIAERKRLVMDNSLHEYRM